MNPYTSEAYSLFHEGILALQRAEQQGLRVNRAYVKRTETELTNQIASLEVEFKNTKFYKQWSKTMGKVNIYSTKQLGIFLYKIKKLPPPSLTKSGLGSTDEDALKELNIPDLEPYLKIKKIKKLRDTYLMGFAREQVDGFVHPFFHLHLVTTFRGSSSNPNFQNIPKRDEEALKVVRSALYPRKGHQLLELDFSQLEVRVAACYHRDPTMVKYIETDHDMHKDMAQEIFVIKDFDKTKHKTLRAAAKNGFVFPQFYGDYYANNAKGLAHDWGQLPKTKIWKPGEGIPFEDTHLADHLIRHKLGTMDAFTSHIKKIEKNFWSKRFPVYAQWKDDLWNLYLRQGFIVNKTGFTFKGLMVKNDVINYPVQSSAFHILLWCLIQGTKIQIREKWDTKIIGQIHDAIVLDVHPDELDHVVKVMKCIMENDVLQHWKWITVPLRVEAELCEVDKPWSSKQDYKIH